jgi:hypothetical protein
VGVVHEVLIDPVSCGQFVLIDTGGGLDLDGIVVIPLQLFEFRVAAVRQPGILIVSMPIARIREAPIISATDIDLALSAAWVNEVNVFFETELEQRRVARPELEGRDQPDERERPGARDTDEPRRGEPPGTRDTEEPRPGARETEPEPGARDPEPRRGERPETPQTEEPPERPTPRRDAPDRSEEQPESPRAPERGAETPAEGREPQPDTEPEPRGRQPQP